MERYPSRKLPLPHVTVPHTGPVTDMVSVSDPKSVGVPDLDPEVRETEEPDVSTLLTQSLLIRRRGPGPWGLDTNRIRDPGVVQCPGPRD